MARFAPAPAGRSLYSIRLRSAPPLSGARRDRSRRHSSKPTPPGRTAGASTRWQNTANARNSPRRNAEDCLPHAASRTPSARRGSAMARRDIRRTPRGTLLPPTVGTSRKSNKLTRLRRSGPFGTLVGGAQEVSLQKIKRPGAEAPGLGSVRSAVYLGQPIAFSSFAGASVAPLPEAGIAEPFGTNHTSTRRF